MTAAVGDPVRVRRSAPDGRCPLAGQRIAGRCTGRQPLVLAEMCQRGAVCRHEGQGHRADEADQHPSRQSAARNDPRRTGERQIATDRLGERTLVIAGHVQHRETSVRAVETASARTRAAGDCRSGDGRTEPVTVHPEQHRTDSECFLPRLPGTADRRRESGHISSLRSPPRREFGRLPRRPWPPIPPGSLHRCATRSAPPPGGDTPRVRSSTELSVDLGHHRSQSRPRVVELERRERGSTADLQADRPPLPAHRAAGLAAVVVGAAHQIRDLFRRQHRAIQHGLPRGHLDLYLARDMRCCGVAPVQRAGGAQPGVLAAITSSRTFASAGRCSSATDTASSCSSGRSSSVCRV